SARRETHALLEKNPELIKSLPENFMAEEVSLLLKENQAIIALAKIQEQKIAIAPKTPEYFGALFLEAQILKALRRGEEADYILLTISADGELGGADRAMLQITKDAWNANDHDRAFQFINRLLERFPETSYKDEALYIKGHLFEETHQLAEAKNVYLELHDSTVSLEIKLKTLKRIAWLYLQQESYVFAADSFQKMFATAEEMLSTAQKPKFDELDNLHHHAMFWQAFALSELDSATLRTLHHPSAESIWESLSKMQPPTFYSMLAGKFLAGGTSELKLVSRSSHTDSDMRQCVLDLPARLIDTLAELKSVDLSQFAQFEVDWFLANQMDSAKFSELSRTPIVRIQTDTTRASLYSQFASPTLAIRAASRALKEVAPLETSDERLSRCADFLLDLSYPTAEIEVFREAASTFSVSESTLLAIARTESHFDPKAISSVGAMGLMQLMRETAKTEGLLAENDLFDPKTNISLGTKHISRLLSTYDGNKIFAIAAYNAGQSAVNRWRARMPNIEPYLWLELIGYPETRNYVKSVLLAEEIYLQKLLRTN
ncbi:MAG: transglycosylase SLT domain-containing protein, partial [Deltaproteobacteria bacterium]|nr:transglycosylase SLT domain-containing protein [Deltaproteobacteria bacterium]